MKVVFNIRYIYKPIICTILFICFAMQSYIAKASPAEARDFVQGMSDEVIKIVTDKKLEDSKKEQQLNEMFIKRVDVNWIGKFVAGRHWRESSKEQQEKYISNYSKFLLDSYVPKFKQYIDQKITIGKFSMEAEGEYLVETTIDDQDGKSYRVNYKLRSAGGSFEIYDIIAEGVSMITTQRSEFGSILDREGMDSLVTKLAKKN